MSDQRFKSVPRRSLAEEIADRLTQMILSGELRPGEQLPPERDLATMLAVSRPSLREALRMLAQKNIIDRQHGRGTYVNSFDPDLLAESFDYLLSMRSVNMSHILEVRRLIEVGAVGLATRRANDGEIQMLERLVLEMRAMMDSVDTFVDADMRFHYMIAEATHNPLLSRVITSFLQLSRAFVVATARQTDMIEQLQRDHETIVAAIRQRDTIAAQLAMEAHLQLLADGNDHGGYQAREHPGK